MPKQIESIGRLYLINDNATKRKKIKIDLSGASKFVMRSAVNDLKKIASYACKFKMENGAENLTIDTSGACDIKAYDLQTNFCKVDASGALDIKIRVEKEDTSDRASVRKMDE